MYKKYTQEIVNKVKNLRHKGLSPVEISKKCDVPQSTVWRWTKDIRLTDNQINRLRLKQFINVDLATTKASVDKSLRRELAYNHGRQDAINRSKLHAMGCMLYWGEGSKPRRQRGRVCLVNSDPYLLKLFINFLTIEYSVPVDKIGLYIQYYEDGDIDHIKEYWSQQLVMPISCFKKAFKKKSKSNKTCNPYGTCSVVVCDTLLLSRIIGSIEEYGKFYRQDWNTYQ